MKKWTFLLIAFALLFIAVNVYLIEKKNNKIARLHYVSKWETVKQNHLIESFTSDGVVIPSETQYFYVDKEAGFNQFLVKEGDTVETGTPLFDYSSSNIEKQKRVLDTEIDRIEQEIESIDTHLQNLSSLLSDAEKDEAAQVKTNKKGEKSTSIPKTISYSIKIEINQKELEKEKLEQQLKQYEEQKNNYDSEAKNLTIVSNTSGIVKNISYNLKNPVLTIVSTSPVIQGALTEEQLSRVASGMKTISTSKLFKGKITGVIEKISTSPENKPKVEEKSLYPYEISLDDFEQKLHEGYHVNTQVITKEISNATVINKGSMFTQNKKHYIWVLNKGIIEKKPITLGFQINDKQQINSGARVGDFYINKPESIRQSGRFITPLNIEDINKKSIKQVKWKSTLKYVTIGILQK
ncbi:efflux RND transporter periplasmic adaptor subunit [Heyndrickxia vini]|uniref:Efflux RND transporter periplasmic adaptor subunit n=1 Tax=Heyndrickxia vini TaxID=1476025 RepID=A0ABX7E0R9_9BACI|nr:efflux RND transporter periplasmic adaptor subunit [Heyndrickxia vini]QQZ09186.1 efflux RND transporter periplasmic adaptor subunit [Heyndrickxia vini]